MGLLKEQEWILSLIWQEIGGVNNLEPLGLEITLLKSEGLMKFFQRKLLHLGIFTQIKCIFLSIQVLVDLGIKFAKIHWIYLCEKNLTLKFPINNSSQRLSVHKKGKTILLQWQW